MMNLSDDTEDLEDFIRLDFADLQASENLQLLDPGIIDLECNSEDECTNIKEPESCHTQPDLTSQSVTTSHSDIVDLRPMCIKVVDCYKFPWYFDKFKDIIEHNIAINERVEVDDGILDDSFTTDISKELVDNTDFVDMSVVDSVTMQRQVNDCRKEVAELNKEIDVITAKKLLENKKPITGAKCVRNNVRSSKMDFDIRRAMEEGKNTVVDLKKNIGLVGMKIIRIPIKLPVEISINKQLKKEKGIKEKGSGNKQGKGSTSSSHVKALDKILLNVTSTTPVFEETVNVMKDGVSNQIITENSSPEPFIRSISTLVEKETYSNDPPANRRCTFENELSVNTIAEEMYTLLRPQHYAANNNQNIFPNSCNTITKPTKATEEKNIKRTILYQKYISEGSRKTKMIDPIPISPKNRNKHRMKSHFLTKASEIIDVSDEMSSESPIRKSEQTMSSTEVNTRKPADACNRTQEKMKVHKTKEKSSKYKPRTVIAKPKIVLSTKKPNKLTATIIKIKEKQQRESSLSEPIMCLNPSSNTIPSSTVSKSRSENRSIPTQGDTGCNYKNVGAPEQLLNEIYESKNIKNSSPNISIAQLQYSNRTDFDNALSKDHNQPNTTKNKVSSDSNVVVKTTVKENEKVSTNNYPESATESSVTVNPDESNNISKNKSNQHTENIIVKVKLIDSTKEKLKQQHDTQRFPAVNPLETTTNNLIPTIVSSREKSITFNTDSTKEKLKQQHDTQRFPAVNPLETTTNNLIPTIVSSREKSITFNTVSSQNSSANNPAENTMTQNNQSTVMTEPLTVYNSMQAHTLYKPSESPYKTFRQSQYNAMRFPSHVPQMNQPIYNYMGHPLQNLTHHVRQLSPHIDTRSPSSGINEKILPQMFHRLPITPLQSNNFGAPMLSGITPNMPTRMRYPGPNGYGPQMPTNPRPMSPLTVSSQISGPVETVSSQMPMNYQQMFGENMQSYDVLWSGPFSCMQPPLPHPSLPTHLPASQDISTSSPKSLPQSMDSSIIGRNINGIVKKINIAAPVIEQKEEIDSKAGIGKTDNLKSDASTPLYDEISDDSFEDIEPVNTKKEMLRILNTGLQREYSLTPADGIQKQVIQHSTLNDRPNSKIENLLSQGKISKLPNEITQEKCINGSRKFKSTVENLTKVDKTPSKEHQKSDRSFFQKKENQHKSNHYLLNFKRKPIEKNDKKREIPKKNANESVKTRVEIVAELSEPESDNIKISANQCMNIPKHIKCIQDFMKGNKSKKLSANNSKITFEDLFGDGMDDSDFEKSPNDKKSTGKRHSALVNTEKTSEKSDESSVKKRPADDEKPTLSPKYRPGPLSKKKKLLEQESVNPHQTNKKQILQSKPYSDPILPIPTYEKILSNMPSYLCFIDDSSVTANSKYKKASGSVNPKITNPCRVDEKIETEKERLKLKKTESIKKISLCEYKKRSTSERKVDYEAKDNKKKHVEMHRRPSHADSDLGYDSDSTVKL